MISSGLTLSEPVTLDTLYNPNTQQEFCLLLKEKKKCIEKLIRTQKNTFNSAYCQSILEGLFTIVKFEFGTYLYRNVKESNFKLHTLI